MKHKFNNYKTAFVGHWLIAIVMALILSSCFGNKNSNSTAKKNTIITSLKMVDKDASPETKALYANLWSIRDKGTMIGHHESLLYGRNWINKTNSSDVKDVCGHFPAVNSLDFSKIENETGISINGSHFDDIRRVTKEAYKRGEVTTFCWHADNPLTGGNSWDNSNNTVVKEILSQGSKTHVKFKRWLNNIAEFANTLTDDNGEMIPIIFRPFHEHTQTWNWWGKQCATEAEFIALWQFTVKYLRDEKNIHHFIYTISPQMDSVQPMDDLLFRWPGDEYVDVIGMDCYHGTNTQAFINNLEMLKLLSIEKNKPFAVTETGLEGLLKDGQVYSNYWTKEMLKPLKHSKASLVIFWRNAYDPKAEGTHFFGPFENHAASPDFLKLYADKSMLFSNNIPNMYVMPSNIKIE